MYLRSCEHDHDYSDRPVLDFQALHPEHGTRELSTIRGASNLNLAAPKPAVIPHQRW